MQTHAVIVKPNVMQCSCGIAFATITGAEAQRLGYQHARAESGTVTDFRQCSAGCTRTRARFNCPDHWHHPACFNRKTK